MTTFEGIVTLDGNPVPVTVGLGQDRISLVAGDVPIGDWSTTECVITENSDGTWVIEAEQDSLSFLPEEPSRFARTLQGEATQPEEVSAVVAEAPPIESEDDFVVKDGPEPRQATMTAFYILAAVTAILGLWAIISLIF